LSAGVVASANASSGVASLLLSNPVSVWIGKISFSLYMWHQPVLAFARYAWVQEFEPQHLVALYALTIGLSVLTYVFVEQPFRNKQRVSTRTLLIVLGAGLLVANGSALFLYANAGVWRDIPELEIARDEVVRNQHALYNDRIHEYDRDFVDDGRLKVLVVGNSFARDWANVLLESRHADRLQISYIFNPKAGSPVAARAAEADVFFWGTPSREKVLQWDLDPDELWAVGTKNFGTNNGIFYNHRGDDYLEQRTRMQTGTHDENDALRRMWGDRYLDYIGMFISQDTRHLTRAGARYFAGLFDDRLGSIFDRPAVSD
jgi:hypothetical protein